MRSTIGGFARRAAIVAVIACSIGGTARAAVVYTYTGSQYVRIADVTPPAGAYTTGMKVTGFIELTDPLLPSLNDALVSVLDFSFNDGRTTITSLNATTSQFRFSTNGSGQIVGWDINLLLGQLAASGDERRRISTTDAFDFGAILVCGSSCGSLFLDQGLAPSGQWALTSPSPVPLPAPFFLLAAAIGALGVAGLWRKRGPAIE